MKPVDFEKPFPRLRHVLAAWAVLAGAAAVTAGGAWLLFAGKAEAHEAPSGWAYPLQCCSNRDCAEIPASRVSEGPEGYRVTLFPGDHDFVKAATSWLVPYASAKNSPDGAYHICISPSLTLLCFFAGARAS